MDKILDDARNWHPLVFYGAKLLASQKDEIAPSVDI